MATGFGFCSNCGTTIGAAGQSFCAGCGAGLPASIAAPVPAAVPAPPPAAVPAPPPAAVPAPPPAWAPPPAAWAPPPAAWAPPPVTPVVAPARATVSPAMLLVGGLIIAAIVGVAIFATNNGPKGSPGSSVGSNGPTGSPSSSVGSSGSLVSPSSSIGSGSGSIEFIPDTIGCPSQTYTTVIRLPASVKGTDELTYQVDETTVITQTVTKYGIVQQADGTWFLSDTNTQGSSHCSKGPGLHTARLLDSSGNVLAQGSFTLVMSPSPSPSPTPTPLAKGTVTSQPSSFSCSGASVSVTLSVTLPGSIPANAMITSELDGVKGTPQRADEGFVMQSDGWWLSRGTVASSTWCSTLDPGEHTIRALDANDNVLAEGSFTVLP